MRMRAASLYGGLLAAAEGVGGKLEVATAIGRAVLSRLRHGRGALHVRRPVVIVAKGIRWWVPERDNSFASCRPGEDNHGVLDALRRLLAERPQPVCLDIGANLGYVCMPLAREFPRRRFVAIEPIPWLADALARTARLNGFAHVRVIGHAIADATEIELEVPTVGGVSLTTLSSGAATGGHEAGGLPVRRHRVPAIGLDALLEREAIAPEDLACVKIDVEGFEAAALATGPRALAARPPVLFEAQTPAHREAVEGLLAGFGYRTFRPLGDMNVVASA